MGAVASANISPSRSREMPSMTRSLRFRPAVCAVTLLSAAALPGCTASGEDTPASEGAIELGAAHEALAAHRPSARGHAGRARHHVHRGHPRRHPDCTEEPAPTDPVVFTPASAAAHSQRRAGVAVQEGALASEPIYGELIAANFSDVTPENATKWGPLQPEGPNTWSFDAADAIVTFAGDHELAVKGHTLVWHQQLPSFIDDATPPRQLARYSERHIERLLRHYQRDVYGWDVVNEALADDGSGLRPSVFSNAFGEEYIDRAFRLAHRADRDAALFYNDYGIEGPGPKSDAALALVTRLLARRVPIDGVGFQGHLDARFAPSFDDLVNNLQRFALLGLRVNVSELDVQVARLGGSRAYRLAVQKQIYQRVAAACVAVPACDGITTWGFSDAHSWIDSTFGADDPLLFDDGYQKKPAYFGYVDGFLGVPLDEPTLAPNLIGNGSLEAGLDGWSVMGTGQLTTEVARAHTGLRSARASERAASWQGPRHDVTALVSTARGYDASVWVSIEGGPSATVNLTAMVTCADADPVFLPLASASADDASWVELAGTLSVPACDVQNVALYVEGPDAGVDVLVDDLALREVPPANLIDNADFESGTSGWFGFGPVTLATTSDAHEGESAAIASDRTDTWNGIAIDLTAKVTPSATYHAEAWLKIGAPSDAVRLTAAVTCQGAATQFLPVAAATGHDSDWTLVSGSLVVPGCALQSVVLYAEGPAAGVSLAIDDVAVWPIDSGAAPNVIANAGFEAGTDGWFGFGPVTAEATAARAHGGAQSARIGGRTDTWQGLATSLVGRLTPGASYSVSAWAQVGSGTSPVNLTFQNACDGGADSFSFVAGAVANDATWTQLQGTLVAPSCTLTNGNLYIEGAPAAVDIYLDDVEVRLLP
jgi:endo-1,4-beta-xylanase